MWHSLNESKWPTTRSVLFFARKLPERVVGHLKCSERVVALFLSHNAFWAFFSLNERIRTLSKCVVVLFFSHNAFWAFFSLKERIQTLSLTYTILNQKSCMVIEFPRLQWLFPYRRTRHVPRAPNFQGRHWVANFQQIFILKKKFFFNLLFFFQKLRIYSKEL